MAYFEIRLPDGSADVYPLSWQCQTCRRAYKEKCAQTDHQIGPRMPELKEDPDGTIRMWKPMVTFAKYKRSGWISWREVSTAEEEMAGGSESTSAV